MEVRPIKLKDLVKVRELEIVCIKEYFEKEIENKWDELPKEWKENLGASNPRSFKLYLESGLSFVAVEDDEIMGFIFAQMVHHVYNAENMLWVENMGVHPYFRRNGIGFKLLRAAVDEARKQGATVAHAAIQPDNLKSIMLFKKIGFFMDRREVALLDLNDLNKKKKVG
ncbi:MAG: GNAT family N-acetyltransferase [Methanomassiliicoccaceae archaeon]|jgi:aminoglycoside 6'-N-acetyltransferase I|nr:GNAT family N-acetyltransferase [Methanomassiliicoccaceae archaeon]